MIHPKPNPVIVLQRIYVEHPAIVEQLLGFLEAPGFGSFTVYAERGQLTHAELKISIKDEKGKPPAG